MKSFILTIYQKIFLYIFKNQIKNNSFDQRIMHNHLISLLATSTLMWAYTIIAGVSISNKTPFIIGFICSLIHLCSPLLYLAFNNYFIISSIFLVCGIIHQATFAFFTGGFHSNILIWFGILPLISGVISGIFGALFWGGIGSFFVLLFLILEIKGYNFPFLISNNGQLISHMLISIGWIFLSTIIIWGYLFLEEIGAKKLEIKNKNIENLVFIMAHDISNPLNLISLRNDLLKNKILKNTNELNVIDLVSENLEKIRKYTNTIVQIVTNVKKLYAIENGKTELELNEVLISEVINELKLNFNEKLEDKKINVIFVNEVTDAKFYTNKTLFTYQILANLLSNSIKFSNLNSNIIIEFKVEGKMLNIVIKDEGIGIPNNLISKIFALKIKTNRVGTNGEAGTGFGLPIVKIYVEKLGGNISLTSIAKEDYPDEKTGTTFKLTFPLEYKYEKKIF